MHITVKGPDWGSYVKKDGLLITGQNPASSEEAAIVLLNAIKENKEKTGSPKKIINLLRGITF